MSCNRTIASFGDVRGHSHGMERFTLPYSIEITPEQYLLLSEEECMKLKRVDIKFLDPNTRSHIKLLPFYVCAEERAERERIDEEYYRANELSAAQEAEEKRISLLSLAAGPKKIGRDSWCFIKSYDPHRQDLYLHLFGMYQVFRIGTDLRFVLKQTWDGQTRTFQDFHQGEVEINDVILSEALVSVGYGDFFNLTPDKIQEN